MKLITLFIFYICIIVVQPCLSRPHISEVRDAEGRVVMEDLKVIIHINLRNSGAKFASHIIYINDKGNVVLKELGTKKLSYFNLSLSKWNEFHAALTVSKSDLGKLAQPFQISGPPKQSIYIWYPSGRFSAHDMAAYPSYPGLHSLILKMLP